MKRLVIENDVAPDHVEKIIVRTGENVIDPGPLRIEHATTALEGKFRVPFQMAAIVLHRKAGLEEFSDAFVASGECQAMQRRVTAALDPDIIALGKDKVMFEIELTTTSGDTFTGRSAEAYRGGPKDPLSWTELEEKFIDCATGLLFRKRQTRSSNWSSP